MSKDAEFEGRVRMMMKKQDHMIHSISSIRQLLNKNSYTIERKIQDLTSGVKKIRD